MLSRLQLSDFRNYGSAEVDLSPSLNVILGDNGSGKTSLLEAIYFIGSGGRSFSGGRLSRLVHDGAEAATLYAEVLAAEELHRLGVRRTPGGIDAIKLDGQTPKALSEVALFGCYMVKPHGQLVLVSSTPHSAYTPNLSTS